MSNSKRWVEKKKQRFRGVRMYKKPDRNQETLDDFILPFGGRLKSDNRWVKMARMMPWDFIEDIYLGRTEKTNLSRN